MQEYTVGPVVLQLEKDNHYSPVEMQFSFSIPFQHIVPDTMEEARDFHDSVARTIKFLQGIHSAYVTETSYEETELFVTGRINNISIEVPDGCNKIPLFGAILYHKTNALMKDFPIEEFKVTFKLIDDGRESISTDIIYSDMTYMGSKIEAIIEHYEDEWRAELQGEYDELASIADADTASELYDHPSDPWWRRCDGKVRDFVKMSIMEVEGEEEEGLMPPYCDLDNIRVLSVDIGEDDGIPVYQPSDNDDPDDDDTPEPDPDGYYRI